jgi:hypothetical protein
MEISTQKDEETQNNALNGSINQAPRNWIDLKATFLHIQLDFSGFHSFGTLLMLEKWLICQRSARIAMRDSGFNGGNQSRLRWSIYPGARFANGCATRLLLVLLLSDPTVTAAAVKIETPHINKQCCGHLLTADCLKSSLQTASGARIVCLAVNCLWSQRVCRHCLRDAFVLRVSL